KAYPRGGVARPAVSVRAQVGSIDKTLYVVGDRIWNFGGPSEAQPFTEMPIGWSRSFGGEGFAKNPLGKGYKAIRGEDGKERHPLPNVENPKELVKSPKDRPSPAGLSAYDFTWPQRFSKIGTYDDEWLKTRYPGFAKDMDLSLFSTAPEDQRLARGAFFEGTEAFRLENMHPELPVIEGHLPGVKARAFITHKPEGGEQELREATMRLDTVHFFPHLMRGLLLFRGMLRIEEDDANDVVHLLLGAEKMSEPKPLEHYTKVLEQRLDRKRGHLFALRDSDLLPPLDKSGPSAAAKDEVESLIATEGLLRANLSRKAAQSREKAAETVRGMGANPDDFMKMPDTPEIEEVPEDVEAVPAFVMRQEELAEKLKADAEKRRADSVAAARKLCEENGFNYDKLMAEGKKKGGGPPRFDVQMEIEKAKKDLAAARAAGAPLPELEAMVNDPRFAARLAESRAQLLLGYRKFAQHFPAANALEGELATRIRAEVEAALARGDRLAGSDLTGADLQGLSFDGVDLRGAFLE
ncbi:MAG TPA: DUF2169 domain-containing protein, partial [Polyangiaceae bacterium]|nr:DUF2169 domain-containing protein [Polyangiaceae bacterium]